MMILVEQKLWEALYSVVDAVFQTQFQAHLRRSEKIPLEELRVDFS